MPEWRHISKKVEVVEGVARSKGARRYLTVDPNLRHVQALKIGMLGEGSPWSPDFTQQLPAEFEKRSRKKERKEGKRKEVVTGQNLS